MILELARLAPNGARAQEVAGRLDAFAAVPVADAWGRAREIQFKLASAGAHRGPRRRICSSRRPPRTPGVELLHYDRDYERIASVTALKARWFVPNGALA